MGLNAAAPGLQRLAALNNACWCDAVCRAHAGRTHWTPGAWFNTRPSPPCYPNLVTLAPDTTEAEVLAALDPLRHDPAAIGWGVKDSFARLDLAGQGFGLLFEARWLYRPVAAPGAAPVEAPLAEWAARSALHWPRVHTPAALAAWEAAWWQAAEPGAAPPPGALLAPPLLQEPALDFIVAHAAGAAVAGAVLTRSEGVLGLSCTWVHATQPRHAALAALVAEANRRHPGLPLVGYESGADLAALQRCGFQDIGPLRVWQDRRPAPP